MVSLPPWGSRKEIFPLDALNPDSEIKAKFQSHAFSLQMENGQAGSTANKYHSIKAQSKRNGKNKGKMLHTT